LLLERSLFIKKTEIEMSDGLKIALDKPKKQNLPCRNHCGDAISHYLGMKRQRKSSHDGTNTL
jgi:hypothetical protein